jgi:hypothetical protein
MVEELLDDTKLIPVSKPLANQLRLLAGRLGVSVSSITEEALEQVLRADELGSNLKDAVDILHMAQVHKGAGLINFQRAGLKDLIKRLYAEDPEDLSQLWYRSGRWYAAYLSNRLNGDFFDFFEQDLMISWNLDESEIRGEDVIVGVRLTSFGMSREFTELLVVYTKGFFEELGYVVSEDDVLPGLISLKFLKKMN